MDKSSLENQFLEYRVTLIPPISPNKLFSKVKSGVMKSCVTNNTIQTNYGRVVRLPAKYQN